MGAVYTVDSPDRRLLSYADVNWRDNRIDAYATNVTISLRDALQTQFPGAVVLGQGPAVNTFGRADDSSPFYGGALLGRKQTRDGPAADDPCTSGFSYRSATGAAQMLAAGHCWPTNSDRTIAATPYPFGQYNYILGYRAASSYRNGEGSIPVNGQQVGDISLLDVDRGKTSSAAIYVGGASSTTSMPVRGVNDTTSDVGGEFSISGRTTGETSGWTVVASMSSYTASSSGDFVAPVVRAERQGHCIRGGDSGAPVYTVASGGAYALGILSGGGGGGNDQYGGYFDPCRSFYSRVQNAPNAFGGRVLTSP